MNTFSPTAGRRVFWAAALIAFFCLALTAHAQDPSTRTTPRGDTAPPARALPNTPPRSPDAPPRLQTTGTSTDEDKKAPMRELLQERRDAVINTFREQRDQIRSDFQEKREELIDNRREQRPLLEQDVQARFEAVIQRIINRLYAALDRLSAITDRIESRITWIEANHEVNLASAKAALTQAQNLIPEVRSDIEFIATVTSDVLSSENPRERFGEIRDAITVAKEGLKAIHQALRDAVVEIKASAGSIADEETEEENPLDGEDGQDGMDGENGEDGEDGTSS